ncbi:leucine-rich repeat domain-containing protein [Nannocystis pusilla]|uniref:leucine-rich repeat domain-containing protein n=1 Tax=Nannocystis pusilla TaxID=889268 RepID=UPI003B79EC88
MGALSASQTSAPTDGTVSGDLPDMTSTTSTTSTDTTSATEPTADCRSIVLPDPSLQGQILADLGLEDGPIPGDLALTVEKVVNTGVGFESVDGLECFPNISFLRLGAGTISDISSLAGLHKLEFLDLGDHQIVDLSPLAGLTELRSLDLRENQVADLSPLAAVPALEVLGIADNPVTSFAPLAGLPLVELLADRTIPETLDGLGELAQLHTLHLGSAGVTDVGPLAGAQALEHVFLADNAIADLTALAALPVLVELDLRGNAVVDVSPLAGPPVLQQLTLADNAVFDPDPLAGAPALTGLNLDDNPLKPDLGALLALELSGLSLSRTGREVLLPFAPQTLRTLHAAGNAIVDLSPIATHTALEDLDLADNDITTLAPILDAPFWANQCFRVDLRQNPLGADVFADQLPTLCEGFGKIFWDQGECTMCLMT